jgi:hypothetical protein
MMPILNSGRRRGAIAAVHRAITVVVGLMLAAPGALACDLTGYDRTPPKAIADFVDAHGNCFRWSSDVDDAGGGGKEIWNYILNATDQDKGLCKDAPATGRPLAVQWALGGIEQTTLRPLPAGKVACFRAPVGEDGFKPMYAPITYDLQGWNQDAYAYVDLGRLGVTERLKEFLKEYAVHFMSSYAVADNVSRDLDAQVRTVLTADGFRTEISLKPTGSIVGISRWAQALGSDQLDQIKETLGRQNARVDLSPLGKFINQEGLRALFSSEQAERVRDEPFLFFRPGEEPIRFDVRTKERHIADTLLILLDEDKVPIARTAGMLLLP